jgi:16S rRNA (adenine1518-N6/adenine1519-N6)-dimethyltransferase
MDLKKSYGQHLLIREDIAADIAKSLRLVDSYGKRVLEVGPGRGALTQHLLAEGYALKVVEADRDMVEYIDRHFPALKGKILAKDFLKVNLTDEYSEEFGLIGNYPYNISSQIVFQMLDYKHLIPEMVGMFQKEVADRFAAKSGNKVYGVISVLLQAFYEVESLFNVSKNCFDPPPKVESAVIRCTRKRLSLDCDETLFRNIVKTTFGQRRKMLRNTLKGFVSDEEILQDPVFTTRPEQLSVQDFIDLTNRIQGKG